MSAYLLGTLIGRFTISYALVWIVIWLVFARLDWRETFRRANHWAGLTATTTIYLIGLIAALPNGVTP